jgi:hypothetical protein
MKAFSILFLFVVVGCHFKTDKDNINVKNIEITKQLKDSIIGNPIKIENIEVAQNEFPILLNWNEAKIETKNLGNGWRLPSKDEITILLRYKDSINFVNGFYWSDSEWNEDAALSFAFYKDITDGYTGKNGTIHVYAVRDLQ